MMIHIYSKAFSMQVKDKRGISGRCSVVPEMGMEATTWIPLFLSTGVPLSVDCMTEISTDIYRRQHSESPCSPRPQN
jgi:hypothetical protein